MQAEILWDTLRATLFATMEAALRQEDSLQKLRDSLVRVLEASQPASCDAVAGIACRAALRTQIEAVLSELEGTAASPRPGRHARGSD